MTSVRRDPGLAAELADRSPASGSGQLVEDTLFKYTVHPPVPEDLTVAISKEASGSLPARIDGQVWNLIDLNADTSPVRSSGEGTYEFEFAYQPEDPRVVLGRDVSELARVRALRLRYGTILNSINLDPNFEVSHLSATAKGLGVVDATELGPESSTDSSVFKASRSQAILAGDPIATYRH